jgi:hypothetical protein
MDGMTPVL